MLAALFAAALSAPCGADVLDDFNAATLIADFQFDDALGTDIQDTLNSANPAAPFDSDVDFAGAATNGTGQFDASGKDNTQFATAYSDSAGIAGDTVYGLFEVSWAFDESIYDPAQDEEFRLSLITFDPRSTFVTAETFFTRTSATEVEMFGNAVGTGPIDTPAVLFGSSGSLLTILVADLDADTIELFYSADGGASFLSTGAGVLDPDRGVESLRLVLNEDFSDDRLLIERFAVAHLVPEPSTAWLAAIAAFALALGRWWRR
ncbi:MAG: hypothetical protein DWQ37_01270 [Planctomycetota bacterium]|nr:MAG: hypothetical protein DWQ37_01270 [Planctomycetota bacterium]